MSTDTAIDARPWESRVITKEPPGSDGWLREHASVLGGHDVASLMGYGFETPLQVWARITGKVEAPDLSSLPHIVDGADFEPVIAKRYVRATGNRLLPSPGLVRDREIPYLAGTPDGLVEEGVRPLGVWEAKSFALWNADQWAVAVPDQYLIQVNCYMRILGIEWADIAAIQQGGRKRGDPDVLTFTVAMDPNIVDWILETVTTFWDKHVQTDTPPPVLSDDVATIKQLFPRHSPGKLLQLGERDLALWQEKEELAAANKENDDRIEEIKAHFAMTLADAQYGALPDGRYVRFQNEPKKEYVVKAQPDNRVLRVVKGVS